MGAHDRAYWRSDTSSSSMGGVLRGLSATNWLIALCVAVFVLDGFLPRQWVVIGSDLAPGLSDAEQRLVLEGTIPTTMEHPQADPGRTPIVQQPVFAHQPNSPPILVAQNTLQSMPFLQTSLYFSTSTALYSAVPGVGISALQVWRFVGFQFCHASLSHLLFNMLGLYFFGPVVERYLGTKRFTAFYLLCGIAGALLYLVLNFGGFLIGAATNGRVSIPGLLSNDPDMPLVGASAGVFGIIIAAARLMPDARVLLFFVIPMRLITLAYGLVLIAVASVLLQWKNAGGEAAHIGGAIAGWYFIHRPERLRHFLDFLGRADPTSRSNTVRRIGRVGTAHAAGPSNAEIDRILDKVRAQGVASLTELERRALHEATRQRGG